MQNKFSQVSGSGVPVQELIDTLKDIERSDDVSARANQIENLRSRVMSPHHSQKLVEILGALEVPDQLGGGTSVVDPQTGNKYPNTSNLIQDYLSELEALNKMSERSFNLEKFAQPPHGKKKTRGNPFRVLMGKVGKLLDHGLARRDITRYLLKEKIWNEDTIEKAVKIVKDYNKKKRLKGHDKSEKDSKKVEAQTLPNGPDREWPRLAVDYAKRSSGELIASICWLNSLMKVTPERADIKEVADRSGVKTMMKDIKSELIKRGMSEKDLSSILVK